jgi:hypothetical protein
MEVGSGRTTLSIFFKPLTAHCLPLTALIAWPDHVPIEFSAQDVEKKKAEPKTPHFLSLKQDIVARSQDEKCRLKYVIHTPGDQPKLQMNMFTLSNKIMQV